MFRNENLEMKVGLFIGIGIFLAFVIVFSISDFYMLKEGYNIGVKFDFVNGLTKNSPVRLAGVHVGDVKDIKIYYDEDKERTRIELDVRLTQGIKVEKDVVARINTLGLLGEQYLELTPGNSGDFLGPGDEITGVNPVNVGQQMETMSKFVQSAGMIAEKLSRGEGTLGKLLTEETVYIDLRQIVGRLKNGEGTLGKLLTEETVYNELDGILRKLNQGEGTLGKLLVKSNIYNDLEYLARDLKAHPWKLFYKTSTKSGTSDRDRRGTEISPR
jgi:phospholipid/cholesterol/gamma-HCH transport system substrate-binding protein